MLLFFFFKLFLSSYFNLKKLPEQNRVLTKLWFYFLGLEYGIVFVKWIHELASRCGLVHDQSIDEWSFKG